MNWMPVPALGGVNLFDDPRALRDEELQLARNLVPVRPGILKKRSALLRPFAQVNNVAPTDRPHAMVMSPVPGSVSEIIFTFSTATGSGTVVVGVTLGGGIPASQSMPFKHPRVPMLAWNNAVYMLPGPHAEWAVGPSRFPFYVFDVNTEGAAALTELAFAGTGNENVYPSYAFPYKQRLVLANFGKGFENTIVFTDDYTADVVGDDVLSSNGRAISLVAGADGDEIVGGIEVMLTNVGSPAESALLILRKYGNPFLLTGDMDQTGSGDSTLDIKRISVNCGCAGQYTVARTPVGIVWAGVDDVWGFASGVLPHRIGTKIQPALRLTPVQLQYRWSGAFFDGFYRLAVWGEGQPQSETDAPGDQWWIDLRDGLPGDWREARWWGPQQFLGGATDGVAPRPQTWGLVAESRAGKDAALYYMDRVEVAAADYGTVIGYYGSDTRDMTADASYIPDYSYVDPEITSELITKEYVLAPARDQINDGIMMSLRPSNDLTISADFVLDDGDQVSTRTKRLSAPDNFRLDSSKLDQTDGSSRVTGRAIKTALYPNIRRAAQTHRFHVYDTSGHTIVQGFNDTLVVVMVDNAGGNIDTQWIVTLPPGAYSISDLVDAAITYINLNGSGVPAGQDWYSSITSGIVTLTAGGPYLTSWAAQIKFAGTGTPTNGTAATQAQLDACRRLMAIMGFDTSGNSVSDSGLNPELVGSTAPFKKGIADWEIYGVAVNMEVLPRTP